MDDAGKPRSPIESSGPEKVTAAFRQIPDGRQVALLAAFLESAITTGYRSAVVDLCDMQDIDDDALDVIVGAAARMAEAGHRLTVRSSTTVAWRIAEACPSPTLLRLELYKGEGSAGDRALLAAPAGARSMAPSVGLVDKLVASGAIPANEAVVDRSLRLVVSLAHATIDGADGVSISLQRQGRLTTVAASDRTVIDMDAVQYATGEGPCVDAATVGHRFHAESLDHEGRWPAFTPQARELGINAILSTPLRSLDQPVGAINIYSRSPKAFGARGQELALIFAGQTSSILGGAVAGAADGRRATQQAAARLKQALRARQVIALAQGVVMVREDITEDGAFDLFRDFSRRSNRPLRKQAEDIVASTGRTRSERTRPPATGYRG